MAEKLNEKFEIKITEREKEWAITTHLITLIGLLAFVITIATVAIDVLLIRKNLLSLFFLFIPVIVNLAIPLIMWSSIRNVSPFVKEHCKQSLNFQLSITLYFIISIAGVFIIVGAILLFILVLFDISSVINAFKKAKEGEDYHYPLSINIVH